jgi:hypothetical protein
LLLVQQRLGLAAPNSSRDGSGDGQTQQYLNLANTKPINLWVSPTFLFISYMFFFLFQPGPNKNALITP